MDFTSIISDLTTGAALTVGALTALAVVKVTVDVARWGYSQVIDWFGMPDPNDLDNYDNSFALDHSQLDGDDDDRTPEEIANDDRILRERGEL